MPPTTTMPTSSFPTPSLTIDGASAAAADSFEVINPATGKPFLTAPEASSMQLDAAFEAATRAFRTWRDDDEVRRAALRRSADFLVAAADDLAPLLTAEHGKPLRRSLVEIHGAAGWLRYYADLEIPREVVQDDETAFVEVLRQPLGPVSVITPWNAPLLLAAAKIGPALRAGDTVVLKPSPFTPLTSLRVGELFREAFPPGVFNVVSGGDALGAAVANHPLARKITFTGSTETGKRIAAAAASDLKRLTLEMGGNDPAIVLDDADVESCAAKIFATAFNNNGQACVAPKRVYAAESVLPELVEALAALAGAVRVGDGAQPDTELGPLNNRPQLERVSHLVADALGRGATAVAGGRPIDRPGYFYQPTILTGVADGVRIVDEEQFGPALPVIGFRHLDEAVERANATHFGLGASVWSADTERAAAVAERLDAGMCWINNHTATAFHLPFSGTKWSGLGVEGGPWGLHSFTDMKVMYRSR